MKPPRLIISGLILLILTLGTLAAYQLTQTNQDIRQQATGSTPNVLVIMADDLDEASFNVLLNNNKLPNIKTHLINKGVRFTNSFVSYDQCCPSRAIYLSGKYSHNSFVTAHVGDEGGGGFFNQN